jgi:DNA polymerase-3 subunit gamma/tau
MRDGLSLLDQVIASCGNQLEETRVRQVLGVVPTQLLHSVLEAIHAGDARRVLDLLGQLATEGYELAHFCAELTRTVRNLMVAKSCGAESPLVQVASEERARLAELAKLFGEEDLARFFNLLLRTESEMRYSLQPRFHLELGLMKLVHARRLASLEALLAQLGQPGPVEKSMGTAPKNLGTGPVRSVPLKTPAVAPPQESVESPVAPAPPTTPVAPAEARATTRVAPTGEGTPVASPVAAVETVQPAATVSTPAEDARLSSIKAVLFDQSKRFLSSCLDHLTGFRFENGEVHFTFKHQDSLYADLLKAREQQETLRAACAQVLGQPVRIYVTLEEQRTEAQVPRPSARERAERDPGVEAFRKKFDGTLLDVQDLSRE